LSATTPEDIVDSAAIASASTKRRSLFALAVRNTSVIFGGAILIVMLAIALLAPFLGTVDPTRIDPAARNKKPGTEITFRLEDGKTVTRTVLMGTDSLGRDVYSRVIYGTRVSLIVGVVGTSIATFIGVTLGVMAGFFRGWVDTALSRITDVVLSVPILLLGLGIGAACSVRGCLSGAIQPGVRELLFLIAFATWTYIFRIVRGLVLSMREREFVEASRALGASNARIMFREILPNLIAPIIVYATLLIPLNILFEAALSFLGVGIRPPTASWGQMIAAATPIFNTAWWYMVFPGIALLLTVLAFNLLGDGLQDALNPRTAR